MSFVALHYICEILVVRNILGFRTEYCDELTVHFWTQNNTSNCIVEIKYVSEVGIVIKNQV